MKAERKGLAFFIDRPVLAWVINLLIIIAGLISLFKLQLRESPIYIKNQLSIIANYNAEPPEFEHKITKKIVDAISGTSGLIEVTADTTNSQARLSCIFDKNTEMLNAKFNILSALNRLRANRELPHEMLDPRIEDYDSNIDITAIIGELKLSGTNNTEYIERLKQLLRNIPGTGNCVILDPSSNTSMLLYISPIKMRQYNVPFQSIKEALHGLHDKSFGAVFGPNQKREVYFKGSVTTNELLDVKIRNNDNQLIKLKDIAILKPDIVPSFLLDGEPFILFRVDTSVNGNPVTISKEVIKVLEQEKSIGALDYRILNNIGEKIEHELYSLYHTLLETIVIVLLVVGLILGSWRMSLVILVTLPISLMGTFIVMLATNCSINYTTLLALIVAIGLIVDDAIIVGENNLKVLASKKFQDLKEAAAYNITNIQYSIIGMTAILVTVYLPIYFISLPEERAIKELAITLAAAVSFSGIVALVLSPTMCARLLTVEEALEAEESFVFHYIQRLYAQILTYIASWHKSTLRLISIIFVLGSLFTISYIYDHTQKENSPPKRTSSIFITTNMHNNCPLSKKEEYIKELTKKCKECLGDKYSSIVKFIVGVTSPEQQSNITIYLHDKLPPGIEGKASKLASCIYETLSQVPNGMVLPPTQDNAGSASFIITTPETHADIEGPNGFIEKCIKCIGNNLAKEIDPELTVVYKSSSEAYLVFPRSDLMTNSETERNLSDSLYSHLRLFSTSPDIKNNMPGYEIRCELGDGDANELTMMSEKLEDALSGKYQLSGTVPRAYISTLLDLCPIQITPQMSQHATGYMSSLNEFVRYKLTTLDSLHLFNGKRSIGLRVTLRDGVTPQTFMSHLQQLIIKEMPGCSVHPIRETKDAIRNDSSALLISILALVLVLLFLAAMYESFLDAFLILPSALSGVLGGIIGMYFIGASINNLTYAALISLLALVGKYGIFIVSFSNDALEEATLLKDLEKGASSKDFNLEDYELLKKAAVDGAEKRLRAIFITTVAMILGFIFVLFSEGEDALARYQFAITMISGFILGPLFTIFITPIIYISFKQTKTRSN